MLGGFAAAQINLGPSGLIQVKGTAQPTNGGTGTNTWTKGDLLCGTGTNTTGKLAIGPNTDILVADSTQTCGFKWATPPTGSVSSITTTTPIAGGPITTTGAISCPTCAIGPGTSTANHLAKFSGTDGVTLADGGAIPAGTVTSVGVIVPSPLSASGSPVTSSGSVTVTWGSGQIPAANLGSGSASATKVLQGDSSWVDRPYVIPVQYETAPTASLTARHVIPGGVGTVSIATNCPNCTFSIGTAATATTTFTLKKNGSSFGTVSVTSGGSVTWTVTATTFTSGDVITVVAPASPDTTAAQIAMSVYATR